MPRLIAKSACLSCFLLTSCIVQIPDESTSNLVSLLLEASVTEVDPFTGLPTALSGTISGDFTGTYSERILEVFLDGAGNLIGGSSLSLFQFTSPNVASISSYNFAAVTAPILLLDANGDTVLDANGLPIPIGVETAATGALFDGAGALEGAFGDLQTDSELLFTGGDMGLGRVTSSISMLTTTPSNSTP
jgi:hypothetical protein